MLELNNFDSIKISMASPERIREWSRGEVKKPETINYRTLKPEKDGLFCERIFGPQKDWECHCGKFKRVRYKGIVCDRCGVEITRSKVRRERMGHIELAAPVSHIWYFKGVPSRIGLLLDLSPRALEKVLYFASYIVVDPGQTPLSKMQLLSEKEYRDSSEKFGHRFKAQMGAEAIKQLLEELDLDKMSQELRKDLENSTGQKKARIIKRLEVVESFRLSHNKPSWMILDVVPVLPPDLRPMVQLDGGRFATSDLNDLYRRVINRNNRLKRLLDLGAPDIIVRNEKRMLQEAVDALIDNGRRGKVVTGAGNRPLKSLSDMLKGKQGRFRQNLLGKRVDYSGRSVIVVGPELKIYQCGLPREMALELFKPFVMKELVGRGLAHNIKSAKRMVERVKPEVWDVLEEIIQGYPVMLNRAPTLHRFGIQAFEPVLVEGRAIKLHPLVCGAFNADFDGDQMAIHVPLSSEAQAEARFLMMAATNLLKLQDGKPVAVPSQDMVLGSYYLTIDKVGAKGEGMTFCDLDEAKLAYENHIIELQSQINVRFTKEIDGELKSKIVTSTLGRMIFNEAIPQDLGFVDRSDPEKAFDLEIDYLVIKKDLEKIIAKCIEVKGISESSKVLDNIKALGFKFSTRGAITISVADMTIPEVKAKMLAETDEKIEGITKQYKRGLITDEERYNSVIKEWSATVDNITAALVANLEKYNPLAMMQHSGARGNINQIRQLAGIRGLMANTSGKTIELPIRSNFREGLDVLEYFISTHGSRKGLADTALRTADSGYLTRRLVDVGQDTIVREYDCRSKSGIEIFDIKSGSNVIEKLEERLVGRFALDDIVNPETKELIVDTETLITRKIAKKIVDAGIKSVKIRSVLGCKAERGVCAKCYGSNLANGEVVDVGEAVGIIAAQSIGEPGTQLTMRTFHSGGVAGNDITHGLPRVEELFEARKPKGLAIISEIKGKVKIGDTKKKREVTIIDDKDGNAKTYNIPYGAMIKVHDGDIIEAGDPITEGSVYPQDILAIKGVEAVENYLLDEVQKVYRLQGVDINDKHIEVIVAQMLRKVRVEEAGDTDFLPGVIVDIIEFEEKNAETVAKGLEPATGIRTLLGITKASLSTESFLSAASFQETTRVLTDAAVKGKVDPLVGLKENVIIGKLIPAGTGMSRYKDISISTVVDDVNDMEDTSDDESFLDSESLDLTGEVEEESFIGDEAEIYDDSDIEE